MTRDYFFYAVQSELRFTEDEVDTLIRCSKRHYDYKCRSLSEVGGFLYGMKNQFHMPKDDPEPRPKDATRNFSYQDLDIVCKVLENSQESVEWVLYNQFRRLFDDARQEAERLNPPQP